MRLLIDTNVLLWTLAGSERISVAAGVILESSTEVFISAASWWEIAIKQSIGKLHVELQILRAAAADSGFLELPVLGSHVETLARLPLFHRDPFDRMIVAQAICEPMKLLTGDQQLASYSELVYVI